MLSQLKTSRKYGIVLKIVIAAVFSVVLYSLVVQLTLMRQQQEQINTIATSYLTNFNNFKGEIYHTFPKIESIPDQKVRQVYMIKERIELVSEIFNNEKRQLTQDFMTPKNIHDLSVLEQKLEEQNKLIEILYKQSKQFSRRKRITFFSELAKRPEFNESHMQNSLSLAQFNIQNPYSDITEKRKWESQAKIQEIKFQQKYLINTYLKQLSLCVVAMTKNNARSFQFEATLQSILNQEYLNYRLVIIDDASTDHTVQNMRIFLRKRKIPETRYIIISNDKKKPLSFNLYTAINDHCNVDDIAVLVKGGDQLLGNNVFNLLNAVYRLHSSPIVYTNHFYGNINTKQLFKGTSELYSIEEKKKLFRSTRLKVGPLKTFKVSLFLQIKIDDLKQEWGWSQSQQSFLLPMLQMACGRVQFINQFVYFQTIDDASEGTKYFEAKIVQQATRNKPEYKCLDKYDTLRAK